MAVQDREVINPYGTEPVDMFNKPILVGDVLAKAFKDGSSGCFIKLCKVTEVKNDEIFLDESPVPIKYPSRCIILR